MRSSGSIHLRLFAQAPIERSAELAGALVRCLADYGDVDVSQAGSYRKVPGYLEFTVDLTTDDAAGCVAEVRALASAGWSGDVWNHRPDGPHLLLPEIRWAWLVVDRSRADDGSVPG